MAAYQEDCYYYHHLPPCLDPSFGAETGDLGVGVGLLTDHLSLVMMQPPVPPPSHSSTGYLEDMLPEWPSDRSKRRRRQMVFPQDDHQAKTTTAAAENVEDVLLQGLWDWSCHVNSFSNSNLLSDLGLDFPGDPFDYGICSTIQLQPAVTSSSSSDLTTTTTTTTATTTATDKFEKEYPSSSKDTQYSSDVGISLRPTRDQERKKRKGKVVVMTRVASPFAVVKPVNIDGDVTLDDINEKILRRPRRPVRHPVGEFACLPCVANAAGLGLSGKAVVGLTRIYTKGRGTITIIRTR